MRRLSLALVSAVSVMTFTHVAAAADLGRPVYKAPPPAPPPVQDWSGIYSGWEGGYGWGKQSFAFTIPGDCFNCNLLAPDVGPTPWVSDSFEQFFPDVTLSSVNQRGWLFGSFVGAQKQWGSWVLGIETDIDAANIKGSATSSAVSNFDFFVTGRGQGLTYIELCPPENMNCVRLTHSASIDSKIDRLGSVRGKVGWSFGPDWLIYGTGGVAFAHVKNTVTSDESSVAPTLMMICWDPSASSGTSIFGWTAGAGIDWKWRMDQGSALVFGVEYLHYGFGDHSVTFQTTQAGGIPTLFGSGGNTFSMTTHDNVDVVKARISYLFSIH